jgi:ferredoxin/DMSO/TMAO reductase YedYZ heme-binding membrane subunit
VASASQSLHLVLSMMGFASFIMLWLSLVAGFVLRNSWTQTWIKRPTLDGIHQTLALIGLCLGAFHGLAQLAVPGGSITLLELVVPFVDSDDPIGLGVGVVGFELLVAVALSVAIQRRLGYGRWRVVHLLAYAAFMLVVAHVLISGTDVTSIWVWLSVLGAWLVTVVLWLTTTSILDGARLWLAERRPSRHNQDLAVRVDAQLCSRFGFCEHVAPDVFQLRDGQLSYVPTVRIEQSDVVKRAIEICPTRAITLGERHTGESHLGGDPLRDDTPSHDRTRAVPGVRRRNAISQW